MTTMLIIGGCVLAALCVIGVGAIIAIVAVHIHQVKEEFY